MDPSLFAESNYRSGHKDPTCFHLKRWNAECFPVQLFGETFRGAEHERIQALFKQTTPELSRKESCFVVVVCCCCCWCCYLCFMVNEGQWTQLSPTSVEPVSVHLRMRENHILKKQPHVSSKILKQLFCFCLLYRKSLKTKASLSLPHQTQVQINHINPGWKSFWGTNSI